MMEVWLSLTALACERFSRHPRRHFSGALKTGSEPVGDIASEPAEAEEFMARRAGE
jgi:hypothetical protein